MAQTNQGIDNQFLPPILFDHGHSHTTPRDQTLKIKASRETANPDSPKNKLLESSERKVKLFVSARWSDAKSSKIENRTPASVLPQVLTSARSETKTKRKNCLPKNKRVCTVGRGQQLVQILFFNFEKREVEKKKQHI